MSQQPIVPAPDAPPPEINEAQRSLNEALRLSFTLLRTVMALLLAYFGFSGLYSVEQGTVAIQLRFGRVLGEDGQQARMPGGPYFALPAPLDQKIVVDTTEKRLALDEAFWFAMEDRHKLADVTLDQLPVPRGGLEPGIDGALVTGDQNLVHGQWVVVYKVKPLDAARFVQLFGGTEQRDRRNPHAERAIQLASERGIVSTVAGTQASDYLSATFDREAAKRAVQQALDGMAGARPGGVFPASGVTIVEVLLGQPTPPLAVRGAFQEVAQAESEKAQRIEDAKRERARTLNAVAGQGYAALLDAVDRYEAARATLDDAAQTAIDVEIAKLLDGTDASVGGRVSQLISEAETYATRTEQRIRSERDQFLKLLPLYEKNPRIAWQILLQDAQRAIYSAKCEKFYVPSGQKIIYLELNKDPNLRILDRQDQFNEELDRRRAEQAK